MLISTIFFQIDSIKQSLSGYKLTVSDYKDIATIIGVIIACGTLIIALFKYSQQGKQKRAEYFFNLRKKLKENEVFKKICYLVDIDGEDLLNIHFEDKRDFLGLFEEVAIMKKSGLVKKEIAFYMFGYYAIRCWDSIYFWNSVNKNSPYWKLFKDFVEEVKDFEKDPTKINVDNIKI